MVSFEFCNPSGNKIALSNLIDKSVLSFLNRMTEPWKEDEDLKLFFSILNGTNHNQDRLQFKLEIGSARLMKPGWEAVAVKPFYPEFISTIIIAGRTFFLNSKIIDHEGGATHEYNYVFDLSKNIESLKGVPQSFSDQVCKLILLNREIKVKSELTSIV